MDANTSRSLATIGNIRFRGPAKRPAACKARDMMLSVEPLPGARVIRVNLADADGVAWVDLDIDAANRLRQALAGLLGGA